MAGRAMSDLPTFNQIVSAIPACPECGANSYLFRARPDGDERAHSVVCRSCNADILAAYTERTTVLNQNLLSIALAGLAFLLAITIGILKVVPMDRPGP